MGCCGEPIDKPIPEEGNRITPFNTGGPVSQQPNGQTTLQWQEKSSLPSVATPPPVLQYGQNGVGQQPWNEAGQFNIYGSNNGSVRPMSTYDGSAVAQTYASTSPSPPPNAYSPPLSPPLAHPTAIYAPNASRPAAMTVTGRRTTSPTTQSAFAPPADEGKLSVSIDFGE